MWPRTEIQELLLLCEPQNYFVGRLLMEVTSGITPMVRPQCDCRRCSATACCNTGSVVDQRLPSIGTNGLRSACGLEGSEKVSEFILVILWPSTAVFYPQLSATALVMVLVGR